MTDSAVERRFALRMTVDTEAHVDFMHRHDPIHLLHVAVTFLALDARVDVRSMLEAHEVRQRVHAVPSNLERRLCVVGPRARHRLDTADEPRAMTSDASGYRRSARALRASRILVAVLTGNLMDARVDAMAEGNRLDDIRSRRPGTLGKGQRAESEDQQDNSKGKQGPVHVLRENPGYGSVVADQRPASAIVETGAALRLKFLIRYFEEPNSRLIARRSLFRISPREEQLPENRDVKLSNITIIDDQATLIRGLGARHTSPVRLPPAEFIFPLRQNDFQLSMHP
jgi:hypothetical protein